MGRTASGVRGIRLREMIMWSAQRFWMKIKVLVITENGYEAYKSL